MVCTLRGRRREESCLDVVSEERATRHKGREFSMSRDRDRHADSDAVRYIGIVRDWIGHECLFQLLSSAQ